MIRTVTLSVLLFFFMHFSFSQEDALQHLLNRAPQKISKIDPKQERNNRIIPSDFSEFTLTNNSKVPKGELQTIYYIYTGYRWSASFDQKKLNANRIQRLAELMPEVLENRFIEWKIIEQTGCSSPQMGKTFFHGFVLEYRLPPSESYRQKEIENLQSFLLNPETGYANENDPSFSSLQKQIEITAQQDDAVTEIDIETEKISRLANFPEGNFALYQYFKKNIPGGGKVALNQDDEWVSFTMSVDEEGKISDIQFENSTTAYMKEPIVQMLEKMPDWSPAIEKGKPVPSEVDLELRMSFSPIVRGMYHRDGKNPEFNEVEIEAAKPLPIGPDEQAEKRINKAEHSAVYRAMDEVISQEKVAVVMDVTSSMSLHLASMNWWVASNPDSLNIVHYTFFNDGDNREDRKKKSGKTGGIYHGKQLRDLPATLLKAMRNGNGGDVVENDFEALVAAQSVCPYADALFLIVDNFSDVRDEDLLSQITIKTHVLISGDVTVVRECYLNLAKATGGDVLVNGKRIKLENVRNGGRITIAESTYLFNGATFKLL